MRGFHFDPNRCTGCQTCELSCTIENSLPWGTRWRQVVTFNERHRIAAPSFHLSLACNHCLDAPCLRHCPALAISRSPATDAVLIDADLCIGCGYCSWACPHDAPVYDARGGVMTKCTLCDHRLAVGLAPACVTACPTGCLDFGDLDDDGPDAWPPGFPADDIGPLIRFAPLAPQRSMPATAVWPEGEESADLDTPPAARHRRPVRLASEWPLIAFSLAFAGLVGAHARLLTAGTPHYGVEFLAAAFAATVLSSLHLGRKLRAWRAVLNVRRSWLSREVAAFAAFVGLAAAWQWGRLPAGPVVGIGALAFGLAGLYAVDRVYDLARRGASSTPHSAEVLWTGGLIISLLVGEPLFAAAILGFKLFLYVRRHELRRGASGPARSLRWLRPALSGVGLALWLAGPATARDLGWVALGLAEILDRCEFYLELEFASPARQMTIDLLRQATEETL